MCFLHSCLAVFAVCSKSPKTGVVLCGAIPKFEKTVFFLIFAGFAVFSKSPKTGVALCGAMWRYVALSQKLKKLCFSQFLPFLLFSANLQKQAWRYVALSQNLKKLCFSQCFAIFCAVFSKSPKTGLALCGTMWCYPKIWKNNCLFHFCCLFFLLSENLKKQAWRYTAVSQNQKKQVFQRHSTMWRCPKVAIFSECI